MGERRMNKINNSLIFIMGSFLLITALIFISDPYSYWTETFWRIIFLCLCGGIGVTIMSLGAVNILFKRIK